jgi:hypothetical protein
LITAALTMGRHDDKTADTGGEFRASRRRRATQARQRNLQSADQQSTDGGDEARAGREVREAEAELDRPEDDNARGRNFCGWVAETAPRYSNGMFNTARD